MTTTELAKFALIRAKIELECVDDPELDGLANFRSRRFVRESTLISIKQALEALDNA